MLKLNQIHTMRSASYLLPDPGGEVVRECLDEIERLKAAATLRSKLNDAVVDVIDTLVLESHKVPSFTVRRISNLAEAYEELVN